MPILAYCRRRTEPAALAMRGFSLLELLVVLVLLGLAAGLIAPSLSRTADRVQAAGDRDDVLRRIQGLPAMARQAGRPFRWEAGSLVERPGIVWPSGWRVVALTPLELAANGWCEGGQLQAQGAGLSMRLEALAPDCRVVELTDAP